MSGEQIKFRISKGKIHYDYENFEGDACKEEEKLLRAALSSVGVKTDVEYSDLERERETETIRVDQREKI